MSTTLKAYEVRDNYEGHACVVFAKSGVEARRIGAQDMEIEFEDVESCCRAPQFDAYAPGPVPPLVLIEHGWWWNCSHCERKVSNDMSDDLNEDGLNPADFVPEAHGDTGVFCSAACAAEHAAEKRARGSAEAALLEVFDAKFPGAKHLRVHIYGHLLESSEPRGGIKCSVTFTYPGGQHPATWVFGDETVMVSNIDVDSFRQWIDAPCR